MSTGKLLLLRHGQSIWNLENLFTGWIDVDLSAQGLEEAKESGRLLKAEAAVVVADGPALTAFVARCLDDPAWAATLGDNAARFVASQRGAVAATARMILERIPAESAPKPHDTADGLPSVRRFR